MEDKYILGSIGVGCLTTYGIAALALGHNGDIMLYVVGGIIGTIAGVVGYGIAKIKG